MGLIEVGWTASDGDRLAVLRSLEILDTPAEQLFDDVVAVASALCEAPIALVSLVDEDRQWFKAKCGIDFESTPIEQSVCAHAIKQDDLFIIPDLTQDSRTCSNPLVTGEAGSIRFYAGAPLIASGGAALGSLCVIDTVPRPAGLTDNQQRGLRALGRQVVALIEMRGLIRVSGDAIADEHRRSETLETQNLSSLTAQEAAGIGTFALDVATDEMVVSPRLCQIFGVPLQEKLPASVLEALILTEDRRRPSSRDGRVRGDGPPQSTYRIRRPDGDIRWIERRSTFERDSQGRATHMFGIVEDVTERVGDEARQNVMNHELHHRMKNTLAMVQALTKQTLRGVADRDAVGMLDQRLFALSKAHDVLLKHDWKSAGLNGLITEAVAALGQQGNVITSGADLEVGPRTAIAVAMLIHELGTNAMKHGSLSRKGGTVRIDWHVDRSGEAPSLSLQWSEHGGPPARHPERRGFGTRLIKLGITGTGGSDVRYLEEGLRAEFIAPLELAQRH